MSGSRTGTVVTRARRAAAAIAPPLFMKWRQGYQWSPTGTHLAGILTASVLVLNAHDCSVAADISVPSVLIGRAPLDYLFGQVDWVGPKSTDLIVRMDSAHVRTMACYSLATQQLRWESHAPCMPGVQGAPIWSALGSAAGLEGTLGQPLRICLWLPWSVVPRPSGAQSGGQLVRTGVRLYHFAAHTGEQLAFSPDGLLLAAASAHTVPSPSHVGLAVHLLHWRTGEQLQRISWTQSLTGLSLTHNAPEPAQQAADGHPPITTGVRQLVHWASSGGRVHVGTQVHHEFDELKAVAVSSSLVIALDKHS